MKSNIVLGVGLFICTVGYAQNIKDSAKNQLTASVNYLSHLHYFGRVDSVISQGLFPIVSLKSKTGLYLNSTFIFIKNAVTTLNYAGTVIEGGYKFPYSKNFSGNIYYNHFLYKNEVELQQAALKGQTGINTAYNNKVININVGGDLKFSEQQTDYGLTAGIDKLFIFRELLSPVILAVVPSAYVYSGTHNFIRNVKSTGPFGLPSNEVTFEKAKRFTVLSYEFSMPVVLVGGKFNAYISPSFVMPQNLVKVVGRPDLSERGDNLFYFAAGVGVRF